MAWLILGIVVIIVLAVRSIKLVGPDEMAVKVIFGEAVGVCESGLVFDPRFLLPGYFKCYLKRYPKKMYNFDYKQREVITKAGEYRGVHYGAQTLKVNSVAYLNFPREKRGLKVTGDKLIDVDMTEEEVERTHPLIKFLRTQVPIDEDKLKDWTEEAVLGALRVAFGKMTWMESVENIKKITEEAENVFKSADGALIRAGFSKKGIQLVIAEITLPISLQEAMPRFDRQRLEAEAATFEAEQRATETVGTVVEMMAKSRGKTVEDITKEIDQSDELKKEFVTLSKDLIVREMALKKNAYVDIRVEGATGIERMILNALAVWQRMPMGLPEEGPTKESTKPEGKKEEGKPLVKSILADLDSWAKKATKPRKLTEQEKARLKDELNSLPEEQAAWWHEWIMQMTARGDLIMS